MMFQIQRMDPDLPLPMRQSAEAAGFDLHSRISTTIKTGERILVPCGIRIALPVGFEAQIRPRSGLALKHGITLLGAPGTIDSDYRGEIHATLINLGETDYTVQKGDRIAQMVIAKVEMIEFAETNDLPETTRGESGHGSTGLI